MTPFGEKVRRLRRERGLLLKDMAAHLGVSSAYLSALERGERGKPSWALIQGTLQYFHIIWDEADELVRLADLSDPKVKIDTAATRPDVTLLANRLAREIANLSPEDTNRMLTILDKAGRHGPKAPGTAGDRAVSARSGENTNQESTQET
ncbi:helix-turn-helix domain-containing protein [Microvirga flavescens]|uniref:helix-turn-helix domain-containing protein n=1 Tax=Microvirga flavescens TaxID=2249811 RepID=UPI000DD58B3C|nr:helix-turn-helix domain-containing protein [Microvirga flavescens]